MSGSFPWSLSYFLAGCRGSLSVTRVSTLPKVRPASCLLTGSPHVLLWVRGSCFSPALPLPSVRSLSINGLALFFVLPADFGGGSFGSPSTGSGVPPPLGKRTFSLRPCAAFLVEPPFLYKIRGSPSCTFLRLDGRESAPTETVPLRASFDPPFFFSPFSDRYSWLTPSRTFLLQQQPALLLERILPLRLFSCGL